jgi:hypothetical protein
MIKIELKNRFTGKVIFEFSKENNTAKETVIEMLKEFKGKIINQIDLSNLDLSNIDFSNSQFVNSQFDNSQFFNSKFFNSKFVKSKFVNSQFFNSQFDNSLFDNSLFDNSQFDNNWFYNSQFFNSQFDNFTYNGLQVKKFASFLGLYKYPVIVIITTDNKYYIGLGCHLRLVSEWEENFWNNNNEFPNDGSIKSELRKLAFEFSKQWIGLNK